MDKFKIAFDFTRKWEGGYNDLPNDPGGATNHGITIHTAKAHGIDVDGDGDTDKDDMRKLPLEIAEQIYKASYWNACDCDSYDLCFSVALFDTAVNCGVSRAKKWATESNGDVHRLIELRTIHYITLNDNQKFKPFFKGWMNRVNDLKKYLTIIEREHSGEESGG
jgi:lysozyme family protein